MLGLEQKNINSIYKSMFLIKMIIFIIIKYIAYYFNIYLYLVYLLLNWWGYKSGLWI